MQLAVILDISVSTATLMLGQSNKTDMKVWCLVTVMPSFKALTLSPEEDLKKNLKKIKAHLS